MNIRVEPGLSCSVYRIASYGPYLARKKLRGFWQSYLQSGDLAYDFQKFVHLTQIGQLIHYEVSGFQFRTVARFGLEISADAQGPYVTMSYLEGQYLADYGVQVASVMWDVAARLVPAGCEPRAKVQGRKGWPRFLKKHWGIACDKDGFVSGWQEFFNHGQ